MLTDDDYDGAKALLLEHGLAIVGASGHNGPFGSWYILVRIARGQGLQIVYDGRDRELSVGLGELGHPESVNFRGLRDVWVDHAPEEGAVQEAVAIMSELAGRGGGDAPS